jgi:hypothetical protein
VYCCCKDIWLELQRSEAGDLCAEDAEKSILTSDAAGESTAPHLSAADGLEADEGDAATGL